MIHSTHKITTAPFHAHDSSVVASPFKQAASPPSSVKSSLPPTKPLVPWISNPPVGYSGVTQYVPA